MTPTARRFRDLPALPTLAILLLPGVLAAAPVVQSPESGAPEGGLETAPPVPREYEAPRAPAPPVVDGVPDEPAWEAAPWTEDFVDIRGAPHPTPAYRTRARLLWDDVYLYVAAHVEEPRLWSSLTERDAIVWKDDDFEVFLDPDGDGRAYYEVEINLLGTVLDLWLAEPYERGGRARIDWDVQGLLSAVSLDGTLNVPGDLDRGWTVEMAIPWTALTPPADAAPRDVRAGRAPVPGEVWRVNFSRVRWPLDVVDGAYRKTVEATETRPHPEENWVWSPQGRIDMHLPARWGRVRFVEDGR